MILVLFLSGSAREVNGEKLTVADIYEPWAITR